VTGGDREPPGAAARRPTRPGIFVDHSAVYLAVVGIMALGIVVFGVPSRRSDPGTTLHDFIP
jgi:hypothetical protein